jgi:DNA-binding NarL/FixJ family response regulator
MTMLTGTARQRRFERVWPGTRPGNSLPGPRRAELVPQETRAVLDMLSVQAVEAAAPSALRSYVLGTMALSAGQLAEAGRRFDQALEQARDEAGNRPLEAVIARELAGVHALLASDPVRPAPAASPAPAKPAPAEPAPAKPAPAKPAPAKPALTGRETEVAQLVGRGLSNPEIAAELFISRKAVEFHLSNVYAKCGLQGRQQLRRLVRQWNSWGGELGSFSRDCGRWRADSRSIGA